MSKRKRKAKGEPGDGLDGWNPTDGGGVLKGAKFANPPCPEDENGYHQYEQFAGTRNCRVSRCRLCGRTLGVNRKTGNVRERSAA